MQPANIICDRFEQHYYRVHVMGDPPLPVDIEPIDFRTASMAENFVNGLHVFPGYWRNLMAKCPFKGHDFAHNTFKDTDKGRVSRLMFLGIVKLYPLAHLNGQTPGKPPVPFPSLPGVNGTNYTLAPPSALLTETSPSVKTFTDKQQAARFLAGLNLDQAQLNALSTTLSTASPAPANPPPIKTPQSTQPEKTPGIQTPATITPQIAAMAQALADKQFFLLEQPAKNTPPKRKGPEDLPVEEYTPKPYTLGPHDEPGYEPPPRISHTENPHAGLHNRDELTADFNTSAESFKTTRVVDMKNLSPEEEAVVETLKDQGWNEKKVKQILKSGDGFTETPLKAEARLYGFNTAGRPRNLDNSAYLLDEAGMQDVREKYFKQGHWDREGVKDYLALPCFNAASSIDVMEVIEPTTGIRAKIGKATELLRYDSTDGYTTGTLGKIMGGGGHQITLDTSALKLLSGK